MSSSNVVNQSPFLRTTREFPLDANSLSMTLNKTYVDIAATVNDRTIGLFPTTRPAITGESWFINQNRRQQTLRQVYNVSAGSTGFAHGLNFSVISFFTVIRGVIYDGTSYYPLPYVAGSVANGDIGLYIGPTQVAINRGAVAPTIQSGIVILEWLSQA